VSTPRTYQPKHRDPQPPLAPRAPATASHRAAWPNRHAGLHSFPMPTQIRAHKRLYTRNTWMVAITAVAAGVLAAVHRARSLFASSPQPLPAGTPLEQAAESTVGAGQRTAGLSGDLIDRHSDFTGKQAADLSNAGRTDTTLASHLNTAATLTRSGAHQLDTIVAETRRLAQAAAGARTPADQRMVLAALYSRLSEANAVVTSTGQQAGAVADGIRALDYPTGGRVHAAGFGPGGAPLDPPQPPHTTAPDEAARRRDEATVDDPNADPTARRLAQQRLNDLKYSKFIGPLTTDPITGADARTRAQARLEFQRLLESGQAFPNRPPLTPDEATQLLDKWEAQGRDMILGDFAERLKAAGVSPPGIQRALDEIQSGKTPAQVFHDVADDLSWYGSALGGGAEAHGGALPGGRHWGDAPVWSESDAKALEALGRKLTVAGVGLDAVITTIDVTQGAPAGPAAAEFGGRTLGGFAGGWAAGALWGSLVGPEGTLIVGFLGGVTGAWLGDEAVKKALGE
jgi:hypothetical protein